MLHFLLTKNLRNGKLVREEVFAAEERFEALERFFELEAKELGTELRTVLLNAENREVAFFTHRPCFGE
jgi:hypothetical protein